MTANPSAASKPPSAIRAFIDVANLPSSFYGQGQAKLTRRLVHLMLAKHANPDGTAIHPSQQTLAEECGGLTEYTLGQVIKWLESHRLVRRLPDVHPKLRTIQYELLWPEEPEVAKGKQQAADRHSSKREATRKRTEKWRSRKRQSQTVTQTVSVTSDDGDANLQRSVTQPGDAVTLGCDAVTQPGDACDAENPAFSPSTVLLNRPLDRPLDRPTTPVQNSNNVADADGALASDPHGQDNTSPDRDLYLKEQARLFKDAGYSPKATASHLSKSWAVAQRVGIDVYLGALALWLEFDAEDELLIFRDLDEFTGRYKVKHRTWPLKTFLDSPSAPLRFDEARPIVEKYGVRGNTLLFLQQYPPSFDLTPEQITCLSQLMESEASFLASVAIEQAADPRTFFDDPQGAVDRLRAEKHADRLQASTVTA